MALDSAGVIFAGSWNAGVFRTSDNGATWVQAAFLFNPVLALTVDLDGRVYAGVYGNGVFRTTDQGDTWTMLNSGLANLRVKSLAVHSNGYLFAGTDDGVFRSTNDGRNWTQVGPLVRDAHDVLILPTGHILVPTLGNWMFRSTDGGESWIQIGAGLPTHITRVTSNSRGELFATTLSAGVFRSFDNGGTWVQVNHGIVGSDHRSD